MVLEFQAFGAEKLLMVLHTAPCIATAKSAPHTLTITIHLQHTTAHLYAHQCLFCAEWCLFRCCNVHATLYTCLYTVHATLYTCLYTVHATLYTCVYTVHATLRVYSTCNIIYMRVYSTCNIVYMLVYSTCNIVYMRVYSTCNIASKQQNIYTTRSI